MGETVTSSRPIDCVSWSWESVVRLQGRTALVTGAGTGIGRGIALLFAQEGATIVVNDYDATSGERNVELIEDAGGRGVFVRADVSDPAAVGAMIDAAVQVSGRVDVLVNNAGIDLPQATSVVDTRIEDWDRTLAVNLRGVFLCSRAVIPLMKEKGGGVIVNIASIAGLRPMPQEAAYGASKAGLVLLTKQMARDFAGDAIRVNCVCPGPMEKPTRDRLEFLRSRQTAYEEDRRLPIRSRSEECASRRISHRLPCSLLLESHLW